jgi:murein L,D-transpeptidase YafK
VGAFPVNYPNELDRKLGKTGYGIWLHGTDSASYSRPPRDSEGCVVMTNVDLTTLQSEIKPGITPMVITSEIDWLSKQQWQAEQKEIISAIENWRNDWESMDVERYLSHYSEKFWSKMHTLKSWQNRKRQLARFKTYQKVKLNNLSLFTYPRSENDKLGNMVVARFIQEYRSNNFSGDMQKRIYLSRNDNDWKIVYEGK